MLCYTEDHLIEQPAIQLMDHELGWASVKAYEPPSSRDAGLRRSGGLMDNSDAAVEDLARNRSALSLVAAKLEINKLLRGGQRTEVVRSDEGGRGDFESNQEIPA